MGEKKSVIKEILEWGYCIIIAVVLAMLVRYFVGTLTLVQQESMKTTCMPGERLILNRWVRTVNGEYKRGDIITFEAPTKSILSLAETDFENPIAFYKNENLGIWGKVKKNILELDKIRYIKRIIGVAGDHIEIKDGKVFLNNEELEEKYLDDGVITDLGAYGVYQDVVVPEGYIFVMGDNRSHSTDSRCFGCVPISKIEGKVWIRFWPFSKFGKIE